MRTFFSNKFFDPNYGAHPNLVPRASYLFDIGIEKGKMPWERGWCAPLKIIIFRCECQASYQFARYLLI